MSDQFTIVKKEDLGDWFKEIIKSYADDAELDLNKPEDLAILNKTLDNFAKGMFWGY